jgi:uncharacterized protein (TIGR00251 family)
MWVKARGEDSILTCRVQPNARKDLVGEVRENRLVIHLCAPAVEGKANEALVKFLSARLKVAKSRITLIQGEKNRNKVVAIRGIRPEEISRMLGLSL